MCNCVYVYANLGLVLSCTTIRDTCHTDKHFLRVSEMSSQDRLEQVNVMLLHRICQVADDIHGYL